MSDAVAAYRAQIAALEAKNRKLREAVGSIRRRKQRVPPRPWGEADQPEAARGGPWWAVRRMGIDGSAHHGPMFRHASRELADREAAYLAEQNPGCVFVVLEAVACHCVGVPEVRLDGPRHDGVTT